MSIIVNYTNDPRRRQPGGVAQHNRGERARPVRVHARGRARDARVRRRVSHHRHKQLGRGARARRARLQRLSGDEARRQRPRPDPAPRARRHQNPRLGNHLSTIDLLSALKPYTIPNHAKINRK